QLATELEVRGFESLFFPEHTHIPIGRRTPYPMGGELPDEYKRTFDPFVAIAAATAKTTSLILGTGVCLVAQRDPILLAKEVASVDVLSGGRVIFGVGYGWNVDEMEDHGVNPKQRRALVREKVLAIKALWTEEVAGFDGELVHFEPSWSWPKPAQRPHPPIFLGGAAGPTLFRHIVEWADGWMPIGGTGLRETWPQLRRVAEEHDRDPDTIKINVFGARPDAANLDHYREIGVVRTCLALPAAPADVVLPLLDEWAKLL
ncbi:MAG TPA: LLM class F420-dependent oxidoreductase, partial [Acidimicrobiales bacterium]|nr:LLM class F420-dependent oxidoreductase [Acidimicrobiales bacterium]